MARREILNGAAVQYLSSWTALRGVGFRQPNRTLRVYGRSGAMHFLWRNGVTLCVQNASFSLHPAYPHRQSAGGSPT